MNKDLYNLRKAIRFVGRVLRTGTRIPRYDSDQHDLAVIATALFRKAYVQAEAVSALAATDHPERSIPNVRSILEALGELHYLAMSPDPLESARVAFIYSMREVRDVVRKMGNDPDELARIESELEQKEREAPRAFAAVNKLRPGKYWIADGRGKLVERAFAWMAETTTGQKLPSETGLYLYRLLSWDEHHVMAAMLVIELDPDDPNVGRIKKQSNPLNADEFLPYLAGSAILGMMRLYLQLFPELRSRLQARR